ncbi:hypothetical protein BGX38DRAFT_1278326 [Terfezia claveryi]|nr:hypothetical protein BGX38DRAFT_1278326 [Terfezia claveryi]
MPASPNHQLRIRGATGRPVTLPILGRNSPNTINRGRRLSPLQITTTNLLQRPVQEVDGTRPTWHDREGLNAIFETERYQPTIEDDPDPEISKIRERNFRLRQLQQDLAAVQTAATTTKAQAQQQQQEEEERGSTSSMHIGPSRENHVANSPSLRVGQNSAIGLSLGESTRGKLASEWTLVDESSNSDKLEEWKRARELMTTEQMEQSLRRADRGSVVVGNLQEWNPTLEGTLKRRAASPKSKDEADNKKVHFQPPPPPGASPASSVCTLLNIFPEDPILPSSSNRTQGKEFCFQYGNPASEALIQQAHITTGHGGLAKTVEELTNKYIFRIFRSRLNNL